MSGHSHFATIKRTKEAEDKKRGKLFSKISRMISVAVKQGGADPTNNPKLKMAIEKAKEANMPKNNIERAISKASGAEESEKLEEVIFEAFGPAKVALIITGITDNKNRTLSEIKQILSQYNGKLASEGAVKWMFEKKGVILLRIANSHKYTNKEDKEELELFLIESGAEDIKWRGDILKIYTKPEELDSVKRKIEEKEIKIESASLDWVAKEEIELNQKEKESCQKLFEALDEKDDIQDIYSNIKT